MLRKWLEEERKDMSWGKRQLKNTRDLLLQILSLFPYMTYTYTHCKYLREQMKPKRSRSFRVRKDIPKEVPKYKSMHPYTFTRILICTDLCTDTTWNVRLITVSYVWPRTTGVFWPHLIVCSVGGGWGRGLLVVLFLFNWRRFNINFHL